MFGACSTHSNPSRCRRPLTLLWQRRRRVRSSHRWCPRIGVAGVCTLLLLTCLTGMAAPAVAAPSGTIFPGSPLGMRRLAPLTSSVLDAATVAGIRADADWILRSQDTEGAIATAPDMAHVRPYLANYAALGLIEARRATGDDRYAVAAWRWLRWYQAHQDGSGFVYDYD